MAGSAYFHCVLRSFLRVGERSEAHGTFTALGSTNVPCHSFCIRGMAGQWEKSLQHNPRSLRRTLWKVFLTHYFRLGNVCWPPSPHTSQPPEPNRRCALVASLCSGWQPPEAFSGYLGGWVPLTACWTMQSRSTPPWCVSFIMTPSI